MVDGVNKRRRSRLPKEDPRTLSQVGGDIQQGLGNVLRGAMSAGEFVAENPRLVGETLVRGASYAVPGSSTAEFVGMAPELTSNEYAPGVMELIREGKYSEAASLAAFLGLDLAQLSGVATVPATLIKGGRGLAKGIGELADIAEQQRLLSIESGGPPIGGGGSDVPTKAELNDLGKRIQQAAKDGDDDLKADLIAERKRKQALFDEAKAARDNQRGIGDNNPPPEVNRDLITGTTDTKIRTTDRDGRVLNPETGEPLPDQVLGGSSTVVSPVARGLASLDESLEGRPLTGNEFIKEMRKQQGVTETKLLQSGLLTEAEKAGDGIFFAPKGSQTNTGQGIDSLLFTLKGKTPVRGSIINAKPRYGEMQMTEYVDPGDLSYGATHSMKPVGKSIETTHTMTMPGMPEGARLRNRSHGGLDGDTAFDGIGHSRERKVEIVDVDDPRLNQDDVGKRGQSGQEDQGDEALAQYQIKKASKGMSKAQLAKAKEMADGDLVAAESSFGDRIYDVGEQMPLGMNRAFDARLPDGAKMVARYKAFARGESFTPSEYHPTEGDIQIAEQTLMKAGLNALDAVDDTDTRSLLKMFSTSPDWQKTSTGIYNSAKIATDSVLNEEMKDPVFWKEFIGTSDGDIFIDSITARPQDLPRSYERDAGGTLKEMGTLSTSDMSQLLRDGNILAEFFKEASDEAADITDNITLSRMREAFDDLDIARKNFDDVNSLKARTPAEQNLVTRRNLDQYLENREVLDSYFSNRADLDVAQDDLRQSEKALKEIPVDTFDNPRVNKKIAKALQKAEEFSRSDYGYLSKMFAENRQSGFRAAMLESDGVLTTSLGKLLTEDFGLIPNFEKIGREFGGYRFSPDSTLYKSKDAAALGKAVYDAQRLMQGQLRKKGVNITDLRQSLNEFAAKREALRPLEEQTDALAIDLRNALFSDADKEALEVAPSSVAGRSAANFLEEFEGQRGRRPLQDASSADRHLKERFGDLAGVEDKAFYSNRAIELPYEKASEMTAEFAQTRLTNFVTDTSWSNLFDPDTGELPSLEELVGKGPNSIDHFYLQEHQGKLAKAREGQVKGVEGFRAYNSGFKKAYTTFNKNNPGVFTVRRISTNADIEPSLVGKNENPEELDVMLEFTPEYRMKLAQLMKDVEAKTPLSASPQERIDAMKKEIRNRMPGLIDGSEAVTGVVQSFAQGGMVYKGIGSMGREVL